MTIKESDLQKAVARYLDGLMATGCLFWNHCPNGAVLKGSPLQRAKQMAWLKAEGLKVGFPDVAVYPKLPHPPFFIELKTSKGRLQDTQKDVKARIEALGYRWYTVKAEHGYDAVKQVREIVEDTEGVEINRTGALL